MNMENRCRIQYALRNVLECALRKHVTTAHTTLVISLMKVSRSYFWSLLKWNEKNVGSGILGKKSVLLILVNDIISDLSYVFLIFLI